MSHYDPMGYEYHAARILGGDELRSDSNEEEQHKEVPAQLIDITTCEEFFNCFTSSTFDFRIHTPCVPAAWIEVQRQHHLAHVQYIQEELQKDIPAFDPSSITYWLPDTLIYTDDVVYLYKFTNEDEVTAEFDKSWHNMSLE